MKSQIFVILTVALVCSTLGEAFLFRKVMDRMNNRRIQAEEPKLPEGKMGTRLYNALMQLSGSKHLKHTFFALGNYINNADMDSTAIVNGEKTFNLDKFYPIQRKAIEHTLEDLKTAIGSLNEGFNQVLIPGVQNSQSVLDLPRVFLNPEFQYKRSPFLINVGKLAVLGLLPNEVLPNGIPALIKIIPALKEDLKDFL